MIDFFVKIIPIGLSLFRSSIINIQINFQIYNSSKIFFQGLFLYFPSSKSQGIIAITLPLFYLMKTILKKYLKKISKTINLFRPPNMII